MTLREAIKGKCLECSCGDRNEVKNCLIPACALYPFRLGRNPFRAKRELTEEQRQVCRDSLEKVRINKSAKELVAMCENGYQQAKINKNR